MGARRPARAMLVEVATTEVLQSCEGLPPIAALPESDFTAKMLLENLPAGQDIFYRVRFRDLSHPDISGEPVIGRFRTAPATGATSVSCGPATPPARAGASTGARRHAHATRPCGATGPDFFIHCGDTIYADGPIQPEVKLPDGELWKNLVTAEKSRRSPRRSPSSRGNYKYNLLDGNVRAFNAEVPIFAQWDDHEVTNNWSAGRSAAPRRLQVNATSACCRARGARAFHEFMPIRESAGEPGRVYRKISLRPAARRLHARHAQLSRPQAAICNPQLRPRDYLLGPEQIALAASAS